MKAMSLELKSMLDRPRTGPVRPRNRFSPNGHSLVECDTNAQFRLWRAANRILAKAGAFQPLDKTEVVLAAEMIDANGLHPIWHGRA